MHHIKSDARREAWQDPKNLFARHRPNPKRKSTASRAEEGLARSQTNPENIRPGSSEEFAHDYEKHQHQQTDPGSRSRQRYGEPGDEEGDLEKVMSPDQVSTGFGGHSGGPSDKSSSTEVPPNNNEITSSSYHTNDRSEEKHRHGLRSKLPGFLGGKKGQEYDDNNGKKKMKKKKKKQDEVHFTVWGQFRAVVLGSWVNVLLIFSPVGIALYYAHVNPVIVFVVNFIAIIPLAGTLSYATEEIALRTGEVLGGLLNATFGNAVELIVSIIALFQDQYLIVQTSLLGSMLSNLLLVMGMSFFLGGVNRIEQAFNTTVAQTAASLLFLAVSSLIIPTAFESWAQTGGDKTTSDQTLVPGVIELSHATAVILLLIYAAYLFFQLKSHVSMYTAPSEKNKSRFTQEQKSKWKQRAGVKKLQNVAGRRASTVDMIPPTTAPLAPQQREEEEDDDRETPQISLTVAILTLTASTVLVALNAEYLVDSINAVTCESNGISKTFVGLILLPIVGNAAEHFTAVSVAIKDKMDLSIGVAVGSSLQIALLVLPFVVVVGWIAGKTGMTLYFDGFQLAMLFVSILLVNYLIADGKSHWLEGLLLMMLYIIIAVAAWFYPTSSAASGCKS